MQHKHTNMSTCTLVRFDFEMCVPLAATTGGSLNDRPPYSLAKAVGVVVAAVTGVRQDHCCVVGACFVVQFKATRMH